MEHTINKELTTGNLNQIFFKYVLSSVLAMMGMSLYIVVDTFFISRSVGTIGITAGNIVMPMFNMVFGCARLFEIGAGTFFAFYKAQGDIKKSRTYFTIASIALGILSIIIMIVGIFFSKEVAYLLGADDSTVTYVTDYLKPIMLFAPSFMFSSMLYSMVRNDNAPTLAMAAMVACTALNIILDYVFMFPLKMGMFGASLATCLASTAGCLVSAIHMFSKNNNIKLTRIKIDFRELISMCKLGFPTFILEICGGIVVFITNKVLRDIGGNIAVATYGILMAFCYLTVSIFQGIGQGVQPLFSENTAVGDFARVKKTIKLTIISTLMIGGIATLITQISPSMIIGFFNSENSESLSQIAPNAIRIYSIGLIFIGINIVTSNFYTASGKAKQAFVISLLRSLIFVVPALYILSAVIGLNGVWLAVPTAEILTAVISICLLVNTLKHFNKNNAIQDLAD
ncbi:MAG: MATE family efflux transporter [Clostridia bacterium]